MMLGFDGNITTMIGRVSWVKSDVENVREATKHHKTIGYTCHQG